MVPFLLMFVVIYFLLLRPQQKRAKEHQAMLTGLQRGDEVVTRGGIIGRVSGVQDRYVVLELQEKVRVRVVKSYIDGKHTGDASDKPTKPDAEASASN